MSQFEADVDGKAGKRAIPDVVRVRRVDDSEQRAYERNYDSDL